MPQARSAPTGRGERFAPDVEEIYVALHLRRVRLRVRIWFTSMTFVVALMIFTDVLEHRFFTAFSLLRVGALVPCTAALTWLTWSRCYGRLYMPFARWLVPTHCCLVAILIAHGMSLGQYLGLASLPVQLMAAIFFTGLLFRDALITTVAMIIVFVIAALATGVPETVFLNCLAVLLPTGLLGAFIYSDIERTYRKHFLEGALNRELATRDGLSGLMNRRAFDEHLSRVWLQALRDRRRVAVLMIDIDHFKQYNDSMGHQAGDAALREVARVLADFARRPLDLAARYGGEEFAVILYDMPEPLVKDTAERIREAVSRVVIASTPFGTESGAREHVTVSVGVGVSAPSVGRSTDGAIQLADEALYEAKQGGRNRVVLRGVEDYRTLVTGVFKRPGRRRMS